MCQRSMPMPNNSKLGGAAAASSTLEVTGERNVSNLESVLIRSFRLYMTVPKDIADAVLRLPATLGKMP